jgi:hypothetical protein
MGSNIDNNDRDGNTMTEDPVVAATIEKLQQRSRDGMIKFGISLERQEMSVVEAIDNAIEEALDTAVYLEKAKRELMRG